MGVTFYGTSSTRFSPRAGSAYAGNAALCLVERTFADGAPGQERAADVGTRGVHLANASARAVLALLGLEQACSRGPLSGEAPLPEVRRAILRAQSTFERRAAYLGRPAPAFAEGADGMRHRLASLRDLVDTVAARGATHIAWA